MAYGELVSALLILAAAIVLAAGAGSIAWASAQRRLAVPSRELADAVRVLDRILAYDDSVAALSTTLREEAQRVTRTYYKELGP